MVKTYILILLITYVLPLPVSRQWLTRKCKPGTSRELEDEELDTNISQHLRKIQGQIEAPEENSRDNNEIKDFLENEESSEKAPGKPRSDDINEAEINSAANVTRFLFSGDVRRSPDDMRQMISSFDGQAVRYDAVTENLKFWPKATLPYTFNKKFNSQGKAAVKVAMQEISSRTCIQFIPRYSIIFDARGVF